MKILIAARTRASPDQLEAMLAELGFHLPKQTILYNMEAREFNQSKFGGAFGKSKSEFEIPGLRFDSTTETLGLYADEKSKRRGRRIPFAPASR